MVSSSNRSSHRAPVPPGNVPRPRAIARGPVIGLAVTAVLLAVGFAMLQRGGPSGGDLASTAVSSGAGSLPPVTGRGDGPSPDAGRPGGGRAAGETDGSAATGPALPADVLDRKAEFVVEDGMVVPLRMIAPGAASSGDGSEPWVPEGLPVAVPAAGPDDVSVPAGTAGPVADISDQQVPGGQDPATGSPVNVPADTGQAPEQPVPQP